MGNGLLLDANIYCGDFEGEGNKEIKTSQSGSVLFPQAWSSRSIVNLLHTSCFQVRPTQATCTFFCLCKEANFKFCF